MQTPAMKTSALATVYLDNQRVHLMGDPRPPVVKVLAAGGKPSGAIQVMRTQSPTDTKGTPLHLDDVIDRTVQPTRPIYLTSRPAAPGPSGPLPDLRPSHPVDLEFPSAGDAGPLPLGSPLPGESGNEGLPPPASPAPLPHRPSHPDDESQA